jgi:hypothetical protein
MAQLDKEASQTREGSRRKRSDVRHASLAQGRQLRAGSPRSLAAQKALAQDDHQTEPLAVTDDRSASVVRRAALPRSFLGNRANYGHSRRVVN